MIRNSVENDILQVVTIWYESNTACHDFVDKEFWDSNYEAVKKALAEGVVVEEQDGMITGFIGIRDGYIAGLFVKEPYRGTGVGKRLLDYAKRCHDKLSLHVFIQNERAVSFYKREGFEVADQTDGGDTCCPEYYMTFQKG